MPESRRAYWEICGDNFLWLQMNLENYFQHVLKAVAVYVMLTGFLFILWVCTAIKNLIWLQYLVRRDEDRDYLEKNISIYFYIVVILVSNIYSKLLLKEL